MNDFFAVFRIRVCKREPLFSFCEVMEIVSENLSKFLIYKLIPAVCFNNGNGDGCIRCNIGEYLLTLFEGRFSNLALEYDRSCPSIEFDKGYLLQFLSFWQTKGYITKKGLSIDKADIVKIPKVQILHNRGTDIL